ncbi:hypothetical protein LOTGIDRAFT_237102 [Lottia gigantea]|uniref:Uncharacterized protein n=1 Tax=Lottia gigantea TaxID=225164 RepID=V3ZIN9_LOTGI|nr:hypothetical protein LOTGIDRAFT_237102 [Lottia gigantea]ESO82195.1 hypothetical protein LOTGIDRAFT_237102 [Lottia gigantea]
MSGLTPRDLKDITDLVSRKLEMYLNIDERERKFDPEGCYRVSPRMHKYDVMYRLLESTEFEKSLKTTPRSRSRNNQSELRTEQTPRSRSRNNQSELRTEQTLRSKSHNDQSELKTEQTSRSRSRNNQSELKTEQTSRSRSRNNQSEKVQRSRPNNKEFKQTEERSRSKSAKTLSGQQPNKSKTRPKSTTPNEINNKSTQQKPATSKSTQDSFSRRYQYRPIAIKTPRSTNTMVGAKQTRRLELYANEVYDNHPVQELQQIHNVCPRIPNNGKVQNYSNHVGAALNTKNYMDFYLKAGLDGNKASPRRNQREITYKGSMSPAASGRCSGDSNQSSNSPQVDTSRAVVTFQSPPSSGSSEATYKVINFREETNPHSSSVTSSEADQSQFDDDVIRAQQPYDVIQSPRQPYDDVILSPRQPDDEIFLPEQPTDNFQKTPRESGNPGDRCKSRLGRKSSSLNINYNSDSEDLSISSSDNERNVDKDTSTRTNSPASTQESLETPSSYQEIDSSDSSNSSVLRYYRLSTGEVYSPRRSKSPKAGKSAVQFEDGAKQRKPRNPLTPRKSPERQKRGNSAQRTRPNLDDSSSSASSSCSPRYTLLRPSSRLLKRSSIRSDSVSEESIDTPRSSTPFQPQRSHRPKTSVRRSRDKQLIDLNLTAVLNREKSEMSVAGTGDDDVFVDESDEFHRASEDATSTQSRGICDESDNESQHSISREEYYMLGKNGTASLPASIVTDRRFSQASPTPSPRFLKTPDSTKENDITTYSTTETVPMPERNVSFNAQESSTEDADIPRGEETPLVPEYISTGQQNVSNLAEEIPKSSESDTHDSQVSGSDVEYLSRGSEGYHKDGRGNSRKRSATRRPPSRGSQWEDEWPKFKFSTPKNLPGNDPDERGDYQYLPENRGNFNEKGYSENEQEYYITTEYNPSTNTEDLQQSSQEPSCGIPPKSRPKSGISQKIASPLSNESRGETSSPAVVHPGYLSQSEIYKAISNLKEVAIDLNNENNPEPSTSEITSSSSEDVKHYNFLLGSDTSPPEVARGEFIPSCSATQSEMSVIIKPYHEPSHLETSLVYDMQEKTDEFRGRVDAEELNADVPADDKENVLGRGLSRASSVTSTLSWSDKYGPRANSHQKDQGPEIVASPTPDNSPQKRNTEEVPKDVVSTSGHNAPTGSQRGMLDEDVLKNLEQFYIKREDAEDEPYSKVHRPEINIEGIMSQLEHLVKAKQMHLDKSSFNIADEISCVRGGDTDEDASSDQVQPEQQYSKLIETLIQSAPAISSDQGSSSGSVTSESDSPTTNGDQSAKLPSSSALTTTAIVCKEDSTSDGNQSAKYPRTPTLTTRTIVYKEDAKSSSDGNQSATLTTTALVHNEDANVRSISSVDATDAVVGGNLKLHQSSFLETALGISGDVTECVVKPKQQKTHLTEKDIVVLKNPCLAVAKSDAGQILDCKSTAPPQKKVNKVFERGKLETRRPRSAAVRSFRARSTSRRRPSSGVYMSA